MKLPRVSAPPGHLAIILSALIGAWFWSAGNHREEQAQVENATVNVQPGSQTTIELTTAAKFGDIGNDVLARPLFANNRQLPNVDLGQTTDNANAEPADPIGPAASSDMPVVAYRGYVHAGTKPLALLAWGDGGLEEWVGLDYEQDGWRVVSIEDTAVRLSDGKIDFTVNMYGDDGQK